MNGAFLVGVDKDRLIYFIFYLKRKRLSRDGTYIYILYYVELFVPILVLLTNQSQKEGEAKTKKCHIFAFEYNQNGVFYEKPTHKQRLWVGKD